MNAKEYIFEKCQSATKDNPVTRSQLCGELHIKDRNVREAISQLRGEGKRIIGSANSKGYYIARSEDEYLKFRAEYVKKAKTILERTKAMDAFIEGQIGI